VTPQVPLLTPETESALPLRERWAQGRRGAVYLPFVWHKTTDETFDQPRPRLPADLRLGPLVVDPHSGGLGEDFPRIGHEGMYQPGGARLGFRAPCANGAVGLAGDLESTSRWDESNKWVVMPVVAGGSFVTPRFFARPFVRPPLPRGRCSQQ
jgi:hypothetical protein